MPLSLFTKKKSFFSNNFVCDSSQDIVTYSTRQKAKLAGELKINKVHTDAKKSYNCNQCGYSVEHKILGRLVAN